VHYRLRDAAAIRSLVLLVLLGCGGQSAAPGTREAGTDGASGVDSSASVVVSLDDAGVLGCTGIPTSGAQVYDETDTSSGQDGTCLGAVQSGAAHGILWQSSPPGTACTDSLECAPTCCACTTAGRSVAASRCAAGKCAAPDDVCCAVAGTFSMSCGTCMPGPSCGNDASDAGLDAEPSCTPTSEDAGTGPFVPPRAPRAACTDTQVQTFYADCFGDTAPAGACDAFEGDPGNSPCILCMQTDSTDVA
jgi:hypothetical protein